MNIMLVDIGFVNYLIELCNIEPSLAVGLSKAKRF